MKKTHVITLLGLVMIMLSFAGCGNTQKDTMDAMRPVVEAETEVRPNDETSEGVVKESVAETKNESAVLGDTDVPVGVFEVETPYCMLTYPLTWQYNVAIEQADTENGHIASFYAVIEGKENIRVFDVIFGEDSGIQGDLVGQVGTVPVFFKTYSVYENEELSYDETEMLMAMIEDITVIYSGLSVLENFS